MLTVYVSKHLVQDACILTSMKSALAGMYPAMSRDSTESKVGRGGSSEAVITQTYTHSNMSLQKNIYYQRHMCHLQLSSNNICPTLNFNVM